MGSSPRAAGRPGVKAGAPALAALALLLGGCQFFEAPPAKLRSPPAITYLVHVQDQLMCSTHLELGVDLNESARLELAVIKEEAGSSRPARMIFDLGALPTGAHKLQVPLSADLPYGTQVGYELAIHPDSGEPRVLRGTFASRFQRSDHVPISQMILQDVMVWDGHVRVPETDLSPPGIESMLGERFYASTASDRAGVLGPGWRSTSETVIRRLACGYLVLEYGVDSKWYVPEEGGRWRSPAGYNSTLLTNSDGSLVFYSLDGTEYLFHKLEPETWYLVRTRVPGESSGLQYRYERIGQRPHLVEARHGSRVFTLRYDLSPASGGSEARLRQVATPEGVRAEYEYDARGRLVSARRIPASGGETRWTYGYEDTDGFALLARIDRAAPDEAAAYRTFTYRAGTMPVEVAGQRFELPLQMVSATRQESGNEYDFEYGVSGSADGPTRTTTIRSLGITTVFARMEAASGMTVEWRNEKGLRRTTWDRAKRRQLREVAPDGVEYRYEHDTYGNVTLIESSKSISRYTYYPPEGFDPPFIKNRMRDREEGGTHKRYFYDVNGWLSRTDPPAPAGN
jgi:YD repeat-containing protein